MTALGIPHLTVKKILNHADREVTGIKQIVVEGGARGLSFPSVALEPMGSQR